ncbi:MAG: transglycosylase domain-containing protein [Deltaproteobacteria bacterium]|nr:transglycosylase domain-containing protein [Deltaproteobacteria bacterium]
MSPMFRNRLKTILLAFTITLTLSIMLTAQVFTHYESELEKRLESKKFIHPTEFFAAPLQFRVGTFLNFPQTIDKFTKLNFRPRSLGQRLLSGDYLYSEKKNCETLLGSSNLDYAYCFGFVNKSVATENSDKEINWLFLDNSYLIMSITKGSPPINKDSIELEPELLAQYLNTEPIMQEELSLNEIPTYCPNAIMAIEDVHFLTHTGFSLTGTLRGLILPLLKGKKPQGGSTITQQLVKNYFLSNERSIKRKAQELVLSVLIEKKFSKDQILETYMNIIYMGQNGPFQLIGLGAASRFYFQKKLSDANLAECALLAAILNGPGVYNPFSKSEKALTRRNLVLSKMKGLDLISELEFEEAKKIPLPNKKPNLASETAPYYIDAVRKQMNELNLPLEGSKIFTGLNLELQQGAQESLTKHLEKLEKDNKKISDIKTKGKSLEGVVLSADNFDGLISVAVGGRNFRMTQFNRAIDSHRQVGSIFKPLVYLTALNKKSLTGENYHSLSLISDEKFEVKYENQKWSPENYSKNFFGPVPIYFALKNSLNAATAKLGIEIGLSEVIETAKALGAKSELKNLPSLTLGAFEMYPTEVLQIYSNIANLGNSQKLSFISKVLDSQNKILFEHAINHQQIFDQVSLSVLVSILKQTTRTGSAKQISAMHFDYPVAGKTGTTSDFKDAWFAGFTPFMTSIVWVGYDQNLVSGLTGASGAVPVWLQYMQLASNKFSKNDFSFPMDKLQKVIINSELIEKAKINKDLDPSIESFELLFDKNKLPSFIEKP